jgi:hypothetical protein
MNRLLLLLFFAFPISGFAQTISGVVKDFNTHLPIANVQIITIGGVVFSNPEGEFSVRKLSVGDKISFRLMGYETVEIKVEPVMFTSVETIYLHISEVSLNTVTIRSKRNYRLDSLNFRKEFAREFSFKKAGINEMFVTVNPEYRPPLALRKPSATSSIASVNLLQVFSLFNKKSNQGAKLKETLVEEEKAKYVDHIFAKNKIIALTKLHGDSLDLFMQRYRPLPLSVKKMNEYEMTLYIKKSYSEFVKSIAN